MTLQLTPLTLFTPTAAAQRALQAPLATLVATALVVAGLLGVSVATQLTTAAPAQAVAQVSVSGLGGRALVSASGVTDIRVSGRGFQSLQGGFGGIYVLFGWVDDPSGGSWKPSRGGRTGVNYAYVPDSEEKDNLGYMRFVTFPGSSTASAANGGEVSRDGSWNLRMRTPGARFVTRDRNNKELTIDCTQVQCGIITIGAHGVVNSTNETFTPVTFQGQAGQAVSVEVDDSAAASNRQAATSGRGGSAAGSGGNGGTGGGDTTVGSGSAANPQQAAVDAAAAAAGQELGNGSSGAEGDRAPHGGGAGAAEDSPAATGDGFITVTLQQQAIQAGSVLGFTAQGFETGEQVAVTLGDGATGAGPLVAGSRGEVAGAIPIPGDARVGTNILRLTGASTGQTVQEEFQVVTGAQATGADKGLDGWSWGFIAVLIIAGLILLFVLISVIVAQVRRSREKKELELLEQEEELYAQESGEPYEVVPSVGYEPEGPTEHLTSISATSGAGRHRK